VNKLNSCVSSTHAQHLYIKVQIQLSLSYIHSIIVSLLLYIILLLSFAAAASSSSVLTRVKKKFLEYK